MYIWGFPNNLFSFFHPPTPVLKVLTLRREVFESLYFFWLLGREPRQVDESGKDIWREAMSFSFLCDP